MNLSEMNQKLAKVGLVLHPTKGFRALSSAAPRMTRETMALRDTLLPKRPAGEHTGEFIVHVKNGRTWRTPLLRAAFQPRGKSYAGAPGAQEASRRYRRMQKEAAHG